MRQNDPGQVIRLFYFSGSGNTKMLVELFEQAFKANACEVDVLAIDVLLRKKLSVEIAPDELVGFVYPIHAFNAPCIVFEFFERLPVVHTPKTFVIKSPGDPFMRGGATSMVRNRLTKKGFDVFYENYIVMPPNVVLRYPDELIKQLYLGAGDRVKRVVKDVLRGTTQLEHNSLIARFLTWSVSGLETYGTKLMGASFKTSQACTLCNACVNLCPTNNITRAGEKIRFGKNCIFCMRCIYACPQKAIIPHWSSRWFVIKDWYNLKKIANDHEIRGEYATSTSNWYFKRLYTYMNEK